MILDDKLDKYHYVFSKGNHHTGKRLVAIDTEWCKNWTAEEKFIPFLITIHTIYIEQLPKILDIDKLSMKTEIIFRDDNISTNNYLKIIDDTLKSYINDDTTIIGHQFSSDLHTMKQCSSNMLPTIELLISSLKNRKSKNNMLQSVADTRYDIKSRIVKEEKLRTVSLRMGIFAVQNELDKMSLTKMYNEYVKDRDPLKREMLLVMNWRHAFQTCLVWLVDSSYEKDSIYNSKFNSKFLLTNEIIYEMGNDEIAYLNTPEYKTTLKEDSIKKYVTKYYPQHDILENK